LSAHSPANAREYEAPSTDVRLEMQISYTISEAIRATGIGRTTLFEAMKTGELPARKLGVKNLILAADLEAYIRSRPARSAPQNGAR
jgi:excisionase family DNA binding protein